MRWCILQHGTHARCRGRGKGDFVVIVWEWWDRSSSNGLCRTNCGPLCNCVVVLRDMLHSRGQTWGSLRCYVRMLLWYFFFLCFFVSSVHAYLSIPSLTAHRDKEGLTPAHIAAMLGHDDIIKFLSPIAPVNAIDNAGRVACILSNWCCNVNGVNILLIFLLFISWLCSCDWIWSFFIFYQLLITSGHTPLHYAALNGHNNCVSTLMDTGVEWRNQAESSFSPLHCAAYGIMVLFCCWWWRFYLFVLNTPYFPPNYYFN